MGKLAFLFAGQGAQAPGMGKGLYEAGGAAACVFDRGEQVFPGLKELCFTGTPEELAVTSNTQPCVYTVDLAAAAALREKGIEPDGAAGFSLGELAALRFAGCFDGGTGFQLVLQRASLMQHAAEAHPGCMTATLKLGDTAVEEIASRFKKVYPVNYNCDGQLVISSAASEMDAFEAAVTEAGGRVRRLPVGGSFHTPMMAEAAEGFKQALQKMTLKPPVIPVWANATAEIYPEDIPAMLARQMQSPVRWKQTVAAMGADGFDRFVELGPGKTLSGFVKRILPGAEIYSVQTAGDAATVAAALS